MCQVSSELSRRAGVCTGSTLTPAARPQLPNVDPATAIRDPVVPDKFMEKDRCMTSAFPFIVTGADLSLPLLLPLPTACLLALSAPLPLPCDNGSPPYIGTTFPPSPKSSRLASKRFPSALVGLLSVQCRRPWALAHPLLVASRLHSRRGQGDDHATLHGQATRWHRHPFRGHSLPRLVSLGGLFVLLQLHLG